MPEHVQLDRQAALELVSRMFKRLTMREADLLWLYLDGTPNLAVELIDLLHKAKPALFKSNTTGEPRT